ncbi:chemotaxis protein CheX [Sphingomonas sp. CGMCC 1.13654]|uniref:Chemotaxis protein CheX n=1 Tax=Sphingomonas chungangi TaxID=2683589 RepID=A0A838L7M6_9SPHN|nr:chemotaxis protein CheX [Sphingomonas chungangi]MBA2935174.1 chemotaxis protein CheX [Sphingomonas chungangi]MVW55252.1 chemotaxis protein CheX [Sphingomonas chungangi]
MTTDDILLRELERDALTEIVNIGVGRAASNLRKMVGGQVLLSVPAIEIVSQPRAARLISEREEADLVAVRQDFSGAFSGRALLIFPETKSLELVRAVTHDELSVEEVLEMEHEALAETGNVILNSCLATMANMLKRSLSMTIPEVVRGNGASLFEVIEDEPDAGLVLFLYIDFSVRDRDIRGYIAMLMSLPSLAVLKELVGEFIERVVGEDG